MSDTNLYVDKVKVLDCNIAYREQKDWQTYADDISIELTLDIGKDWNPDVYIGGKLKVDPVSGEVMGWSTCYKIHILFENMGKVLYLKEKGAPRQLIQDFKLENGLEEFAKGKELKKLRYKSTKIGRSGDNVWIDWQQTASADTPDDAFKRVFLDAVSKGYVKNYMSDDNADTMSNMPPL